MAAGASRALFLALLVACHPEPTTAQRLAGCRAEAVRAVEAGASVAEGRVLYEACKARWGL